MTVTTSIERVRNIWDMRNDDEYLMYLFGRTVGLTELDPAW